MSTRRTGFDRTPWIAVAGLLLLVAPATIAGDCYRAEVTEKIGLADGTTQPPGDVTVCRVRTLSPVSVLHSLSVNGRDQGLFIGTRQSITAEGAGRPTFIFARNSSQALELRGVAYGNGGRYAAYRTDRIGRGVRTRVRTSGSFDLARDATDRDGSTLVLIAAAD